MVIMLVITMVSEWQTDWCEHLVGGYLASMNEKRPETGTVWETGDRTDTAKSYLKTITDSRKEANRYAREASSFIQLASGILPGQWTHITKTHFEQLYLALPEPTAASLIPPLELVWLFNGTTVDKIFCEGKPHGLDIYFLAPENRVIKQISLSRATVAALDQDNTVFNGPLEAIPDFNGPVYPAARFFKVALTLATDTLSEVILRPERLLPDRGIFSRVGIWPDVPSGLYESPANQEGLSSLVVGRPGSKSRFARGSYIKLGFEVQGPRGTLVIFANGRQWAVQKLVRQLREGD